MHLLARVLAESTVVWRHVCFRASGKSLVFVPDCIFDNCLGITVTVFQTTVIADVQGNGDVTEGITFFGLLFERDLLIGSNDSPGLQKKQWSVSWDAYMRASDLS